MERHLLKSAALLAVVVAVIGSVCACDKIGSGCSPSVTSNGDARAATSSAPADAKSDHEPSDRAPEEVISGTGGSQDDDPPTDSAPSTHVGPPPERPWANNTGPSDPEALSPSGSVKITTDGTVLENLDISGWITIDADDVTIRNFRVESPSHYGIKIVDGHRGILLEDGEIYGMNSAGILGVGFTARRLHIHDSGSDGIKAQGSGGPTLVESCFIEKLGRAEAAHADGNQTRGGSNITFRYNNIYMPYPGTPNYPGAPYKSNAAFMLQLEISNFVIEHNWLNGGNSTIYSGGRGVSVRNNIFGRENRGLSAGKEDQRIRTGNFDEWSGNRWEDTGDPI